MAWCIHDDSSKSSPTSSLHNPPHTTTSPKAQSQQRIPQGSFAKDAVRFATFDTIKTLFVGSSNSSPSVTQSLLSGLTAGVVASTVCITPTERLKTALIDDAHRAHRTSTPRHFRGALHATADIWAARGIRGLWAGWVRLIIPRGSHSTISQDEKENPVMRNNNRATSN